MVFIPFMLRFAWIMFMLQLFVLYWKVKSSSQTISPRSFAMTKNNRSAMFSTYVSVKEYTIRCQIVPRLSKRKLQWTQKHVHRHLQKIPCEFLGNASVNTNQISTLCACFSNKIFMVRIFSCNLHGLCHLLFHTQSPSLRTTQLFPLKNSNQSGSPPATSTRALSFPARTKKDLSQLGI